MALGTEQSRERRSDDSFEERHEVHSTLVPRKKYKWRILISTTVINVILVGLLPSLGILLYYDLRDKQVSLRDAIRTPIYFIVSWCMADSWSQTAYTTTSFMKFAAVGSIVTALAFIVNFALHETLETVGSHFLLGIIAGSGARFLMTMSENSVFEYFTKSSWAVGFSSLITHCLGFLLVPLLVAYTAETEGTHYAILMLGVMALQTLPSAILLRKPRQVHSSKQLYLTNQPAYALLHQNEIDDSDGQSEEAETSLSQPYSREIPTAQHADVEIDSGNGVKQINKSPRSNTETANDTVAPLFTDIELVAGTYHGEVSYSFEGMSESPRYDNSELFFQGLARRRTNDRSHKLQCCRFCITHSLHRELHPFKHPALYLGLISMIAEKATTITTWILLPIVNDSFPHSHLVDVVGGAFVSTVTGLASIPVILIPFALNYFSFTGREFTHGAFTVITAVCTYGIGQRLPELHIGILILFGLSNAISAGTLELLLKEILLGNDYFKGKKTQQEDWGKIRGLANTIVGLIILLTTLAIDFLIIDWNSIDWALLFYLTAILQLLAGALWMITPSLDRHCSK